MGIVENASRKEAASESCTESQALPLIMEAYMNKELLLAIFKALEGEIDPYPTDRWDDGWNAGIRKAILIVKDQADFLEREGFVYGR